jgi:putative transposase
MENIARKHVPCQQENGPQDPTTAEELLDRVYRIADSRGGEASLLEQFDEVIRQLLQLTITRAIKTEFEAFIGVSRYGRSHQRQDRRNGYRMRSLRTRYGLISNIVIPRARTCGFRPALLCRWQRSERKLAKLIATIFINGLSTRKITKISRLLFHQTLSPATVSRFNKTLKKDYLAWMNRPISRPIRYLICDAISLKIRRRLISKEALLCAIGITEDGHKEFLGFLLGGEESTESWERLLCHLVCRGLMVDRLHVVTVDGNPGLLSALQKTLPEVAVQRCTVHKTRNVIGHCPKHLRAIIGAELKRMFSATSEHEARQLLSQWTQRWSTEAPKAVACMDKDIDAVFEFFKHPYRHWKLMRTTNVIERAFKEFRRRIKVMETFPTEECCHRIMFSLAQLLNENWAYKPLAGF